LRATSRIFAEMEFTRTVVLYFAVTSALLLAVGLYKPWIVLWWEDRQNRLKVIKLYGTLIMLSMMAYFILPFTSAG
jgi:hypothetical protein